MAVPALRIPMSLDMKSFEQNVEKAKSHTRQAAQFMIKQFIDMNVQIAKTGSSLALSGAAASGALALAGRISLAVGAAKLLANAISSARQQLADMVSLSHRARDFGISPVFLQAFTASAKGAEDKVEALEKALDSAFQSLKPVMNPDWTVWDQGLQKISAVDQSMREMRELFTTDQSSSGLDLFRGAKDQDQRILAVLTYMIQLRNIGQELAALDLAERVFGRDFADKIRTGQQSVESFYNTIERKVQKPDVTNEMVQEAKELDQRLQDAWHTINTNLTPSWNALAKIAAGIKEYWVQIVELMARATSANPTAAPGYRRGYGFDPDANPNDPNTPALPTVNVPRAVNRQQRQEQSQQAAGLDAWSSLNDFTYNPPVTPTTGGVPLPRARPDNAPKIKAETQAITEQFDAIERLINGMQRSNDILQVEYETLGRSTSERERGIAIARAEAAARAANRTLTQEERDSILKLADAYAALKDKMETSRPLAQFAADASAVGRNLAEAAVGGLRSFEDAVVGIVNKTTTLKDAVRNMAVSIANDLLRITVRQAITGPIASGLLGLFGGGGNPTSTFGFNPLAGAFSFGGGRADGGLITGPGTGRSDSILARLSNGEFVVNAAATARHRPLLEAINSSRRFADGGAVEPIRMPPAASPPTMQEGGRDQNVHVTVGVSVDENGNLKAFVRNVAERQTESRLESYSKRDLPAHMARIRAHPRNRG